MKIKKRIVLVLVMATVLLLIGSVYSANSALAEDANASTPEIPSLIQSTEEFESSESAQLLRQYTSNEIQTVSANDVDMSASNFRMEDNKFKFDVCFQMPTKDEWVYLGTYIYFDDGQVAHTNGGTTFSRVSTLGNGQTIFTTFLGNPPVIESKEITADSVPNYRCDTLFSNLNLGKIVPTSKFQVRIDGIMLSTREGEGCLQYGDKVREILKQNEIAVDFTCEQGIYDSIFVVTQKPDSLTQEEAQNVVSNAYSEILTIQGPWVFSGELIEDTKIDTPSTEAPLEEITTPTSSEAAPTP